MSSHHIVREKQEPALLITYLEGFHPENLGQLLEWSPTVIVFEDVYEQADSLGIKIDAVITSNPDMSAQESTRIVITADEPLQDGLKFLVSEQYPSVNILAKNFLLKDYALYAEMIGLVIYTADKKIFPVKPGFSKWAVAEEQVLFLSDTVNLKTTGLKFSTTHCATTKKDGFYTLSFSQPYIFIAENL